MGGWVRALVPEQGGELLRSKPMELETETSVSSCGGRPHKPDGVEDRAASDSVSISAGRFQASISASEEEGHGLPTGAGVAQANWHGPGTHPLELRGPASRTSGTRRSEY